MRILLKWLKRRRQRHRSTWQGFTAVREHCKVARPRIVGRPKTRQAALTTSADLRKRVLLKSPVRENRTPGSVRGPSGNRRSYREIPEKDNPCPQSNTSSWPAVCFEEVQTHPYEALPHVWKMAQRLASRYTAARLSCIGFVPSHRRHVPLSLVRSCCMPKHTLLSEPDHVDEPQQVQDYWGW